MNFLRKHVWLFYFALALIVFGWFKPNTIILGGDFSWPQSFSIFFKLTRYIWDASVNFGYPASRQLASFFPYATGGLILESLHLSRSLVQQTIFYFSFAFSGLGFYFLSKKLGLNKVGAFFAGVFYMFSPFALIVAWCPVYGISFPFYCFLPLNLYFFSNFITSGDAKTKITNLIFMFFSYFGVNFVNPTFFLLFFVLTTSVFIYFLSIKNNRKHTISGYIIFVFLYIFLNSFWILPIALNIQNEFVGADNITAGLVDDKQTMELNSVAILDAFRLRGIWTTNITQVAGDYYYDWHRNLHSPLHIAYSFIFPLLTVMAAIFVKKDRKNRNIIIFMFLLLFLGILLNSGFKTKGLPEYFNSIIFSGYLQRMFRTIYTKLGTLLVLPTVFLVGYSIQNIYAAINNKIGKMNFLLILLISFLYFEGAPFFNGQIIKSQGNLLPSYNVKIPREYFDLRTFDSYLKLDGRYITFPFSRSYNYLFKWVDGGYNGGDFLRTILNSKSIIYQYNGSTFINGINRSVYDIKNNVVLKLLGLSGVKYVLNHKDLDSRVSYNPISSTESFKRELFYDNNLKKQVSNGYFTVDALNNQDYLPHVYIPQTRISTNQSLETLPDIVSEKDYATRSAIYFNTITKVNTDNAVAIKFNPAELKKEVVKNTPVLEYKKINPTKYRIVIHGAKGEFPLIFSEGFSEGWRAYIASPDNLKFKISNLKSIFNDQVAKYKILDGNTDDQASGEELKSFIDKGWISTLGDGKEKEIRHQKWGDNIQEFDYSEKYNIDFISKNFQGTIQNDNLPSGSFYETWLKKPIDDNKNHSLVNGYANSWLMNTDKLCSAQSNCIKNADGSYDFEVVVEFLPQRFFYFGLFMTGATLVLCLSHLALSWVGEKKRKGEENREEIVIKKLRV